MPRHSRSKVVLKKSKIVYKDLTKEGVVGYAFKEDDGENKVELEPKQSDRELFLTACHELGHNLLPELSERQIIRFEKTFGVNLWKVVCRLRRKWSK
jgi:hypothetical protein